MLAAAVVGFTNTILTSENVISWRSVGWLGAILALLIGMGVVTYYYTLEEESGESDEPSGTVSISYPCMPTTGAYS